LHSGATKVASFPVSRSLSLGKWVFIEQAFDISEEQGINQGTGGRGASIYSTDELSKMFSDYPRVKDFLVKSGDPKKLRDALKRLLVA
jgi:hypothetical protein